MNAPSRKRAARVTRRNGSQIDIAGERFGRLTALRPVDRWNGNIIWTCSCDCGAPALRSVAYLRYAVRLGKSPACRECNERQRFEHFAGQRSNRQRFFSEAWKRWRSLYFAGGDDAVWCHEAEEQLRTTASAGWRGDVVDGDSAFYAMTLDEVGAELGISRERVRQIQERALGKVRRALEQQERSHASRVANTEQTRRKRPVDAAKARIKWADQTEAELRRLGQWKDRT